MFWNTTNGEKHAKAVKNLLHVTACKDLALLAAEVDDNPGEVCPSLLFLPPLSSYVVSMHHRFCTSTKLLIA